MEAVKQTLFSVLFGNNVITYSDVDIKDKELIETLNNVDKKGKETEKAVHSENKSSKNSGKNGGLGKKIDTPTIDVHEISSKKLDEMRKKLEKGREIE